MDGQARRCDGDTSGCLVILAVLRPLLIRVIRGVGISVQMGFSEQILCCGRVHLRPLVSFWTTKPAVISCIVLSWICLHDLPIWMPALERWSGSLLGAAAGPWLCSPRLCVSGGYDRHPVPYYVTGISRLSLLVFIRALAQQLTYVISSRPGWFGYAG